MSNKVIVNGVDVFAELEKKEKLLKLYQRLYKDDITLSEIILIKTKIKELENE